MPKRTIPSYEDISFDTVPVELSVMDVGNLLQVFEKAGYDVKKKDHEFKPSEKHQRPRLLSIALAAEELFEARSDFGRCLNNLTVLNNRS